MPGSMSFDGFRSEAIAFLAELAANNDRAWFTPRKAEYERLLKQPLVALCEALGDRFVARGIPLTADPVHSPFRIHRDLRFSRDKSPYKTAASARFPAITGGASGYFHLEPGEIFAGGGRFHPEPAVLASWRHLVDTDPDGVQAALADPDFVTAFGHIDGERFKRLPSGVAKDHPNAELLALKDLVFRRRLSDDDVASPDLPDLLADLYAAANPVWDLLARISSD